METVADVGELAAIDLSKYWWRMNCTLNGRKFFMKIWETARYT
jgi:hypothetical protein